jgi:hypothetical protein
MRFENLSVGDNVFVVFDPFEGAKPMKPGYYPVMDITRAFGFFQLDQSKETVDNQLAFSLEDGKSHSDQDVVGLTFTAYVDEKQWIALQKGDPSDEKESEDNK